MLNKALEYLDSINYSSWLVFTDSDILFPSTFKKMVDDLPITPNVLFSLDHTTLKHIHNILSLKRHLICLYWEINIIAHLQDIVRYFFVS